MARPKAFDRDQALERAMEVFWRQGYEATSIPDLIEGMGIGRQSLYDTFGDKHQLFIQALDRYSGVMIAGALANIERPGAGVDDLQDFLDALVAYQTGKPVRTACLMINSAMELAVRDPEVVRRARAHQSRLEGAFLRVLEQAAANETITPLLPLNVLARHLVAIVLGMVVASKFGADATVLKDMASGALVLCGLTQPTRRLR